MKCPICKGDGRLEWGRADSETIRSEPCPLCLGSGNGEAAAATVRYLRACEAKLNNTTWPGAGQTLDAMTGEVLE